jgi:hypothetical protein
MVPSLTQPTALLSRSQGRLMLVAARLLVAFAYFIHHGLELLLIPFKVLCLLDFVCRYWQRQRINPAVHKLVELSLVRGLRW